MALAFLAILAVINLAVFVVWGVLFVSRPVNVLAVKIVFNCVERT
jgi:hypothetical protein